MKKVLIFIGCLLGLFILHSTSNAQTLVKIKKPGTLGKLLTAEQQDSCKSLIIEGKINSADIKVLRRMAGYKEEGFNTGQLEVLDLRKCEIKTDKNPFMELDTEKEYLTGAAMPKKSIDRHYGENTIGDHHVTSRTVGFKTDVLAYSPVWFLQYKHSNKIELQKLTQHQSINGNYKKIKTDSEGNFHFAEGITQAQWKDLKKKYEIDKFTGHEIVQQGEQYIMKVHSRKGHFFHDTFYKCPNLKIIILPKHIKTDASVFDMSSKITYYKDDKIFDWNKEYWSSYLPQE